MNAREALGLILIVVALVLVPAAWAFNHLLWLVAFVLFGIGGRLFFSERVRQKEKQLEKETGGSCSSRDEMPNDIHDYTGWRSSGKSNSYEDGSSDGSDGD